MPPAPKKAELEDDDLSVKQFVTVFRERELLPWYLVIVVNMFMVGILFGFLPVYVHSLGYGQLTNGMIMGTAAASYLLIQPFAGRLADTVSPVRIILVGLVLSAAALLLVPFTAGAALLGVVIAGGFGVGTVWTNTDALVSNLAQQGRLAATLGAAGSFKELGDMLGPLLIGILSQAFGLKVGFISCGILGLCTIPLLRATKKQANAASFQQ